MIFEKGKYRAYIKTIYKDHTGSSTTIDGEKYEFDTDPIDYFRFETNQQIRLKTETLEVSDAELLSDGDYKGLHYSIYDNELTVLSGTQTSDMTAADTSPWNGSKYVYAKVSLKSGYVFRSSELIELQVHESDFVSSETSSAHLFDTLTDNNWDCELINIEDLDTSNLADFSYMFEGCNTKIIKGLSNLNFTSANNFKHFLAGIRISSSNQENVQFSLIDVASIDPTGTTDKFEYAFGISYWPSRDLEIHVNSVLPSKIFQGYNDSIPWSRSGTEHMTVYLDTGDEDDYTPNIPVNSSYMFYGCNAKTLTLCGFYAPDNCNMSHFFEESTCQLIEFYNRSGSGSYVPATFTQRVTDMSALCKNCTNLRGTPRNIHWNNVLYADEMFYGCTNLGHYSSNLQETTYISFGGPKLVSANRAFSHALTGWYNTYYAEISIMVDYTKDVNLIELMEAGGHGTKYHVYFKFYGGSNYSSNKTVNLTRAFKNVGTQRVALSANRNQTSGDSRFIRINIESLAEIGTDYEDFSKINDIDLYNMYIVNAKNAFKNNTSIRNIYCYDYWSTPTYGNSKLDANADITGFLTGCSDLYDFYSPDNLADQGSNLHIQLPVFMKYYSGGSWSSPTNIADISHVDYRVVE